ncbi:MAG: hypothetical protein ACK47C_09055 [Paracoccaceae bacterium]
MDQRQIINEIYTQCRINDVVGAIQGAVRLARLQGDARNLSYFLLELGLASGDALSSFANTFPQFSEKERQDTFSISVERYMKVHEVSDYHRKIMGNGSGVRVFSTGASTIDSDLASARALASEIKLKESISGQIRASISIWTLRQQAETKVEVISRIRSLMMANSFDYASHIEKTLSVAKAASIFGEELWRDLLVFVRNISEDAENQLTQTYELFSSPNAEKRTHALTSLRRLLVTLADVLFPAQDFPGLEQDKYLNRLSKFVEDALSSVSAPEVDRQDIEKRLRLLNDRSSKAVHAEVSTFEARQCLLSLQLYLSGLEYIIGLRR